MHAGVNKNFSRIHLQLKKADYFHQIFFMVLKVMEKTADLEICRDTDR